MPGVAAAGAAERLAGLLATVGSDEFAGMCRATPAAFTRDRLLTCEVVTMSLLCRAGLSSEAEAWGLALDGCAPACTRQAWDQARAKMDPGALLWLMRARGVGVPRARPAGHVRHGAGGRRRLRG